MKSPITRSQGIFIILSSFLLMNVACTKDNKDEQDENQSNQRQPRIASLKSFESEDTQIQDSSSAVFYYNDKNLLSAMGGSEAGDSVILGYDADGRLIHSAYFDPQGNHYELNYNRLADKMIVTSSNITDRQLVYTTDTEGYVSRMEVKQLENQQWIVYLYADFIWKQGNLSGLTYYSRQPIKTGCPEKSGGIWSFLNGSVYSYTETMDAEIISREGFYKSAEKSFTYDLMKNPFRDFQIFRYSEAGFYAGANNMLTMNERYFDPSGELIDSFSDGCSYDYNSEDLPVEMNKVDAGWFYQELYFYE